MNNPSNKVALVVAAAVNNAIGRKGQLPWVLKDDMALFKKLTTGHPVIMGRKTMDSLGKPLSNRTNIVVSRGGVALEGFTLAPTIEAALALAQTAPGAELICIIGGGQIYAQSLHLAEVVYLSRVETEPEGADAFFPELPTVTWQLKEQIHHPASERNEFAFRFQEWVRRG